MTPTLLFKPWTTYKNIKPVLWKYMKFLVILETILQNSIIKFSIHFAYLTLLFSLLYWFCLLINFKENVLFFCGLILPYVYHVIFMWLICISCISVQSIFSRTTFSLLQVLWDITLLALHSWSINYLPIVQFNSKILYYPQREIKYYFNIKQSKLSFF